ncbi:hypothetical protein ACFQGT_17880 [Natrialbaceae archaeon GCM10025810]|uniref:hypothetical protein n=1 Tax=Halovalidus salilacus TaxID=3075124 RepID=UPI003617DDA3
MTADQAELPTPKLRFSAGRFEGPLITAIITLQFTLVGVTLLTFAFLLLTDDSFQFTVIVTAGLPLLGAYLLNFLYRRERDTIDTHTV